MGSEKLKKATRLSCINDAVIDEILQDFVSNGNAQEKIIFNVPNTKGMKSTSIRKLPSNVLIRVAGGYPDEYVDYIADYYKKSSSGMKDWVFDCLVYNKDELADILEVVENIEKGIHNDWSEKKRAVYLYKSIMDRVVPYIEKEVDVAGRYLSKELRSLRGFVNKISVCAGLAIMYKEVCDRNGIQCNMVLGNAGVGKDKGSHAWNELIIEGKIYPIDLMWDLGRKNQGNMGGIWNYFARNIDRFNREHQPHNYKKDEQERNRRSKLRQSHIPSAEIKALRRGVGTTAAIEDAYSFNDEFGNKTMFGQIGFDKIGSNYIYKYLVMKEKDGVWDNPQIVVSDSCISLLMKYHMWVNCGLTESSSVVLNACRMLFSKENLQRASARGTSYIGGIHVYDPHKKTYKISGLSEVYTKSYKTKKYMAERYLREVPTGSSDGMCVQLIGGPDNNTSSGIKKYNCYRFVLDPANTGVTCRAKIVKDSFESSNDLRLLTCEEVMGKVDFNEVLAFACGKEPELEK